MDTKNKILWGISMIGLLGISYGLCRFSFFEMHGMKQWSNLLTILSITIMVIATIFGNRIVSVATIVGYIGGFILAMIFNIDGVDSGGGRTNNAWIIWGTVFVFSILIGIILGIIYKKRYKNIVGIIDSGDGPTAVYIGSSEKREKLEDKWEQLLETGKKLVIPKTYITTSSEWKEHLIDKYDAQEIKISEGQKLALKITVLINYYPDALEHPMMSSNEKHLDYWNSAQLVSDEKYGLGFACFKIPRTPKTEHFYQALEQERNDNIRKNQSFISKLFKRHPKESDEITEDMELEIELSTGYLQLRNGCARLMNEIILWKGVTQKDIDHCTPTFVSYVAAMRDTGKINL